jgi:hypothetical protein
MGAISIARRDGRWTIRSQGCCGNLAADRRMYEQAFLEQLLADGGRIVSDTGDHVEVLDRRGRIHRIHADARPA